MKHTKKTYAIVLTTALFLQTVTPNISILANGNGTSEVTTIEQTSENSSTEEITALKSTDSESILSPYVVSTLDPSKSTVIVLDPGHDSRHHGATKFGLKEESVVLDIAKSSREELNRYGDVTVYMTRTTNQCSTGSTLDDCLISRNNQAKKLQADFFISFHIDYDDDSKKHGSRILPAYNSGYHNNVYKETNAMGKLILSELEELGLSNLGFWRRKLSSLRYPNGAKADYYSIIRNGVLMNIPSLIIEHGFVTSKSDCNNYFQTKKQRKKLGVADANAIVSYYHLTPNLYTGSFVTKGKSTYYQNPQGQKITGWIKDDGKWYYMNPSNGKMTKGFITLGKNTFYLDSSSGEMRVGWFTVQGKKYFAAGNGVIYKGKFFTILSNTYHFNSKGHLQKGWITRNKKKYYFSKVSGAMLYGWQRIHGEYYFFSKKSGKLTRKKKR